MLTWRASKACPLGHHCPQDAGVLVGQHHVGFLPTVLLAQLMHPARNRVIALVRGPHHRLGALHVQRAQKALSQQLPLRDIRLRIPQALRVLWMSRLQY